MTRECPAATGRRHGKELKHDESSQFMRACAPLDSRSFTTALSVRKKTKGPRAATRMTAPWRQGTERV